MKKILKENEQDQWVKIPPQEYLDYLKITSNHAAPIARFPKFRGKKIWILGNLNLRGLPIKSLEGIGHIQGNLDISSTQISNIDHISVAGYVSDWDSPIHRMKMKKIRDEKMALAKERRGYEEWEINNNEDMARKARALFDQLIYDENLNEDEYLDDAGERRLNELYTILQDLQDKQEEYEQKGLELTDIFADIEVAEEEIEELEQKFSIYHLIPGGGHYEMTRFEIVGYDDLEDRDYAVGDYEEAEESALESIKQLIDDVGIDGYHEWIIQDSIDKDRVEDYARSFYDDDVRESPDSYFDESDYELSSEQEEEKEKLEADIAELEERQNNLEHEIEEPDDYSNAYDEIQEQIDEIQSMIDDIQPDGPTEEQIENKIQEFVDDALNDPASWLKDLGYDLKDFVDIDEMAQTIYDSDGMEVISSYDGSYDTQNVGGVEYYIFRLN
jgi:hypothetical protein